GLGFIFRPPGQDLIPFMGLSFEGRSSGQLTDSLVKDTELLVWGEADVEVQGNTFDGGSITLEGAGTDAIVTGNRLANSNKWGIAVWNGASPVISDNDIIGASTGIDVYAVTNPVIRANNIYDDEGFVDLVARADAGDLPEFITAAEIRGNRISESSVAGIGVHEYASATIESNEVRDNQVGISLVRPGEISIGDNTFCGNEQNLAASDAAAPPIGGSNEICEDT
ncbi:MAG: NosD domain-containing protein, partial [Chloroflexota bacterium]